MSPQIAIRTKRGLLHLDCFGDVHFAGEVGGHGRLLRDLAEADLPPSSGNLQNLVSYRHFIGPGA